MYGGQWVWVRAAGSQLKNAGKTKVKKTIIRVAVTAIKIAVFVAVFMTPVAMFSAAHAGSKGKVTGAGIVILAGLQRNA